MARDRKRRVSDKEGPMAPPTATMPQNGSVAKGKSDPDYRDQMLALVRAMARDAARADHETERSSKRPHDRPT